MDKAEIESRVIGVLVEELGLPRERVGLDSTLEEGLGLDSLGMVELFLGLEGAFGIRISDEEAEQVTTVGQAAEVVASKLAR